MPSELPFAILAPAPLEHLQSGLLIEATQPFVAYGTRKWELLRKVDDLRGDDPVAMLIYPSHEDENASLSLTVAWFGWYIGHVDSKQGGHPNGMMYRPKSTSKYTQDNKGHWAAFWHIRGLRELPASLCIGIGKLPTLKGGWRKEAPPRGPELVTLPESLAGQN